MPVGCPLVPNALAYADCISKFVTQIRTHFTVLPISACRFKTSAVISAAIMGGNLNTPVPIAGSLGKEHQEASAAREDVDVNRMSRVFICCI